MPDMMLCPRGSNIRARRTDKYLALFRHRNIWQQGAAASHDANWVATGVSVDAEEGMTSHDCLIAALVESRDCVGLHIQRRSSTCD